MVATHRREISTRGQGDAHDITELVSAAVADTPCAAGIAIVFVVGSTATVTTIEFEPGAVADFNRLLEEIATERDRLTQILEQMPIGVSIAEAPLRPATEVRESPQWRSV